MRFGMGIFFIVMIAMGYLLAPVSLVWGWIRWIRCRQELGRPFLLSLIGFILTTTSGLLAISTIAYARAIHGFPFYDPNLLRIYRWGFLLSVGGIVLGLTGISAPNALRWHAPLAGLGMLAFWMIAAATE
ncbi:MAG: hypothetical protein ACLPLR_00910 [Terriglobales bacterium]